MPRWLTWRRLLLVLLAVVGLSWLFGPEPRRNDVIGYVKDKGSEAANHVPSWDAVKGLSPWANDRPGGAAGGGSAKDLTSQARLRPSLHPDPSKTMRCETPKGNWLDAKGKERPLVQYAIMIDAGSQGSRIHVYKVRGLSVAGP